MMIKNIAVNNYVSVHIKSYYYCVLDLHLGNLHVCLCVVVGSSRSKLLYFRLCLATNIAVLLKKKTLLTQTITIFKDVYN